LGGDLRPVTGPPPSAIAGHATQKGRLNAPSHRHNATPAAKDRRWAKTRDVKLVTSDDEHS
jgi:hypothetical protein